MRRRSYRPKLFLIAFLVLLLFIPPFFVQKFRGRMIALVSPAWKQLSHHPEDATKQRLEAENHLLRLELIRLQGGAEELKFHEERTLVVPAHIIYRDPGQWMTVCWVDVGEKTNRLIGHPVIEHNAPVLVGRALVGVVDKVYENQSSIRLITDPAVKPSVRVVRGYLHNRLVAEQIQGVIGRLESHAPKEVVSYLLGVQKQLEKDGKDWLLAKGVIQGSGVPLWRGRDHLLKGIGFNCDFPDGQAGARELRTGKLIDNPTEEAMPILQEKDLLITTGLDGVFPMGLPVAEVTKVYPLREGAYAYEIEATPVVKHLEALQTVCIIPKVEFTPP